MTPTMPTRKPLSLRSGRAHSDGAGGLRATVATAEVGVNVPRGLQEVLDAFAGSRGNVRVLEAGCGSTSHLSYGERAHITGMDLSEQQLKRHPHLHSRIVGDIQVHRWAPGEFDVVVCWNVLEHLRCPNAALAQLARGLKSEGLLVLALPNVFSVKGLVAKFTPTWFHVWVYRRIFGIEWAGTAEHGPFPTYLRTAISPRALERYGREHEFAIEFFRAFEDFGQSQLRRRLRIKGPLWKAMRGLCSVLTLGTLSVDKTDFVLVLRKKAEAV
jgi:SAM-dependent methyltransferase